MNVMKWWNARIQIMVAGLVLSLAPALAAEDATPDEVTVNREQLTAFAKHIQEIEQHKFEAERQAYIQRISQLSAEIALLKTQSNAVKSNFDNRLLDEMRQTRQQNFNMWLLERRPVFEPYSPVGSPIYAPRIQPGLSLPIQSEQTQCFPNGLGGFRCQSY